MHELAIAESIVKTVLTEIERHGYSRVTAIGLRIGLLTDIVPDALSFGYEIMTRDTPLAGARLDIEQVPIMGRCRSCGLETTIKDFFFVCPHCHNRDIDLSQGDELDIAFLEIEDVDSG